MVGRFRVREDALAAHQAVPSWGRRGVLFGLATSFTSETAPPFEWTEGRPEGAPRWRDGLANYKTCFSRFPSEVCEGLLYRGWWLAGATLPRYHRQDLPPELPRWSGNAAIQMGGTDGP
jgi:hypothetical protein